jgi:hypothetical protein
VPNELTEELIQPFFFCNSYTECIAVNESLAERLSKTKEAAALGGVFDGEVFPHPLLAANGQWLRRRGTL